MQYKQDVGGLGASGAGGVDEHGVRHIDLTHEPCSHDAITLPECRGLDDEEFQVVVVDDWCDSDEIASPRGERA